MVMIYWSTYITDPETQKSSASVINPTWECSQCLDNNTEAQLKQGVFCNFSRSQHGFHAEVHQQFSVPKWKHYARHTANTTWLLINDHGEVVNCHSTYYCTALTEREQGGVLTILWPRRTYTRLRIWPPGVKEASTSLACGRIVKPWIAWNVVSALASHSMRLSKHAMCVAGGNPLTRLSEVFVWSRVEEYWLVLRGNKYVLTQSLFTAKGSWIKGIAMFRSTPLLTYIINSSISQRVR